MASHREKNSTSEEYVQERFKMVLKRLERDFGETVSKSISACLENAYMDGRNVELAKRVKQLEEEQTQSKRSAV